MIIKIVMTLTIAMIIITAINVITIFMRTNEDEIIMRRKITYLRMSVAVLWLRLGSSAANYLISWDDFA